MTQTLQNIQAMNDTLPAETPRWAAIEDTVRGILRRYGYQEMRLPMLEYTALFRRSIGEATDVVEKEMYTFDDLDGASLTLRPEATAGFVRACIQHGLLHNQTQRLWCLGPMFRHEKPQKGRFRQFHQLDVEAFGLPGPDIDAELILMTARIWRELGLNNVTLYLNSLGSAQTRATYRERLIDYFQAHEEVLDADSKRRLQRNPLRILDSKNTALAELIAGAPIMMDFLDADCRRHFEGLQTRLDNAGIRFEINPRLVRGLDYYNRTVFEWTSSDLGAQSSICGGGRYDGLVEHMGGRATPGIGFAVGLERLVIILDELGQAPPTDAPDVYLVAVGDSDMIERHALVLAESLRERLPTLRLRLNCGGGSFKSQFKRADRSGARYALIIGEAELDSGLIGLKPLRESAEQTQLSETALIEFLSANTH